LRRAGGKRNRSREAGAGEDKKEGREHGRVYKGEPRM